jgi:hypothetical protein
MDAKDRDRLVKLLGMLGSDHDGERAAAGRNEMVRKRAENGTFYREPPYTEEEELEIYRRMASGPFKILRQSRPPSAPDQTPSKRKAELQPDEKEIIAALERSYGRPLTEQEINLSLDQARAIGDL